MGDIARKSERRLASHLYHYEAPFGDGVCVYCGEAATSLDHVPPLSYAASIVELLSDRPGRPPKFRLVPACSDCNSRLTGNCHTTIADRRAEVHRRLRKKHQKLLGEYDWSAAELSELGRNLQDYIQGMEYKRRRIIYRLSFPSWWSPY